MRQIRFPLTGHFPSNWPNPRIGRVNGGTFLRNLRLFRDNDSVEFISAEPGSKPSQAKELNSLATLQPRRDFSPGEVNAETEHKTTKPASQAKVDLQMNKLFQLFARRAIVSCTAHDLRLARIFQVHRPLPLMMADWNGATPQSSPSACFVEL